MCTICINKFTYNFLQTSFGLILYTYCLVIEVNSLPNGAPIDACGGVTDIAPNHRPHDASNNDNVPYYVHLYDFEYNSYIPGKQYNCKCLHIY